MPKRCLTLYLPSKMSNLQLLLMLFTRLVGLELSTTEVGLEVCLTSPVKTQDTSNYVICVLVRSVTPDRGLTDFHMEINKLKMTDLEQQKLHARRKTRKRKS